jgi:hypothetical protein
MTHTYEVRPCIEEADGVSECEESVADFWGVYERATSPDEAEARLATWIADFARKEDALWFSENMRSQT